MNTLSPSELAEKAPAAQPLPKKRAAGLIDTNEFITVIAEQLGQEPVMAVQGRAHSDIDGLSKRAAVAKRERSGRHLIVCANRRGAATIVLNSHTVRRRAWIAGGFYRADLLLVGVALPLQRWRGYDAALSELERYRPQLTKIREQMMTYKTKPLMVDIIAEQVSRLAYLPGHKPIAPEELVSMRAATLYDTLFEMLKRVVNGNLAAAVEGKRKVKPVKGPDALMHAGNVIFNIGVECLDGGIALPTYRKT